MAKVPGLSRARGAWVLRRHVPKDCQARIGRPLFFRYLGHVSRADAERAAHAFMIETADAIARARLPLDAVLLPAIEHTLDGGPDIDPRIDLSKPAGAALAGAQALSAIQGRALAARMRATMPSPPPPRGTLSWADLVAIWRQRVQPRSRTTLKHATAFAARFEQFTGGKHPAAITTADVRSFRDHLEASPIKRATAKTILGKLKTLFDHAVDVGALDANPFQSIKVIVPQVERDAKAATVRSMTREQIAALLDNLPALPHDDHRMIVRLMLWHGMRAKEAANLTRADLSEVDGVMCMRIRDAKNAASNRTIPLHNACADLVTYASNASGAHIFGGASADFRSQRFRDGVRPTLQRLHLPPPHSLRHTWKRLALAIAMPVEISMRIMGHAGGVHFQYGGASMATLADWINRIDPLH